MANFEWDEGVVKMPYDRQDVRTNSRGTEDQTPLLLALSQGQGRALKVIQE